MLKKYVKVSLKRSDIIVHKLRSSFAMEFYKHEKNILALQQRMGHKSINATNIYARASDREEAVKNSRNWSYKKVKKYVKSYLFLQNMIHLLHELHIPHDDECDLLLGAAESMEQVHDP